MRTLTGALILAAIVACARTAVVREEGFDLIHVADVVALRAAAGDPVTVLDANRADFREREGIVPGAVLLSSYKDYDVATELPARKDAHLVFYCADSH